jgi:CHASE3 domain sensor protein
MLGLLATYKDFPEETAARLLSNDLLIDRLRVTQNDEQFQVQIESAIASENQALLEDRAALAKQVETLRTDKERAEKDLEQQRQMAAMEVTKAREVIQAKEREKETLAASHRDAKAKAKDASAKLAEIETAKNTAEKKAHQEAERRRKGEARALRTVKIASIIVAILVAIVFGLTINSVWKWDWLLRHPNSYGLQGCLYLMVAFGIVGLWVKPWRNVLWLTGILGLLFVILQLLGGPNKAP